MNKLHKVFLVEDEIVTREGIRDRMDWTAEGFEFAGEAPDGEAALSLIQIVKPNVLITDIKMPFMSGLDLCRIVHDSMPSMKIVILTGHDEFEYAREAISLGVTEYLLKPITPHDLSKTLSKIKTTLVTEELNLDHMLSIKEQLAKSLSEKRERFFQQLVAGRISSVEALEQSIHLRVDLIARWYQIILIHTHLLDCENSTQNLTTLDIQDQHILPWITRHSDAACFRVGLEEIAVLVKNQSRDQLETETKLLTEEINELLAEICSAGIKISYGVPVDRLGNLPTSFFDAVRSNRENRKPLEDRPDHEMINPVDLLLVDIKAFDKHLRVGTIESYPQFFQSALLPIQKAFASTHLLLEYLYLDALLSAANFVKEIGGDPFQVISGFSRCEEIAVNLSSFEALDHEIYQILTDTIRYRDFSVAKPYHQLISRAKEFIDTHYSNPELGLADVANHVNLSSSHLSVVFSRESGTTFIEYCTSKRIDKAKELLRTTSLRTNDISISVGYENPHYFSTVFKRISGCSPTEYRAQTSSGKR